MINSRDDGFSFRSRKNSFNFFSEREFDFLIVGGGITGAAVARDAALRGYSVALVEKNDFASGTSSSSSKLVHGGLRYLENMEFSLVFEALKERAHLLNTIPNLVKPMKFLFPVYEGDAHGRTILSMGLWLYDLLSAFRAPGYHKRLSKKQILKTEPHLSQVGLKGGFTYYDASMWDDVIVIETLRSARRAGAETVNYSEALEPIEKNDKVVGFVVSDGEKKVNVLAKSIVSCVGPWTDILGQTISKTWTKRLEPSKGIHLVFDLKKLPVESTVVMSHPEDGRIVFVMPRPDLGAGVVIVGTTDSPVGSDPENAKIDRDEIEYLLALLDRYFLELEIKKSDIISAYVGVRPLFSDQSAEGSLQKVSREHHIEVGPGGVILVMGGKYTTHQKMAKEIVEFSVKNNPDLPRHRSSSEINYRFLNPAMAGRNIAAAKRHAEEKQYQIPESLWNHYGAEALNIYILFDSQLRHGSGTALADPEGFPLIEEQLRFQIRNGMVMHLDDFFFRRTPLYLARKDHGVPWASRLNEVLAEERGFSAEEASRELTRFYSILESKASFLE